MNAKTCKLNLSMYNNYMRFFGKSYRINKTGATGQILSQIAPFLFE